VRGDPRSFLWIVGKENLEAQLSLLYGVDIGFFALLESQERLDDGPSPLEEFVCWRDRDGDHGADLLRDGAVGDATLESLASVARQRTFEDG